ncbi:lymphatic vessel endothelial hyaluronic acid receptor 1a [Genypterus blacodes]|uniref:lymphatic vessel endothelial hyaluronic acid receptor 1a n=1 Tax=Genypterus blacodes TaxID=154954 RepID=UPI003F75C59B
MSTIRLCITALLLFAAAISDPNMDTIQFRVFPAANRSVAGVQQVTFVNYLNQPTYAFNASEARELCEALRLKIASKAQVQEALSKGLETCRFGWLDENFAVVPRITPSMLCGKNQTGLVSWRTPVKQKFDAFCFNESDTATQLKDTTSDGPVTSRDYTGPKQFPSEATIFPSDPQSTRSARPSALSPASTLLLSLSSSSVLPSSEHGEDTEAELTELTGTAQGSTGGAVTVVLITLTCGLLIIATIILALVKRKRSCSLDMQQQQQQQQQEYMETEEWTCVKNRKEAKKDDQEDVKIVVADDAT